MTNKIIGIFTLASLVFMAGFTTGRRHGEKPSPPKLEVVRVSTNITWVAVQKIESKSEQLASSSFDLGAVCGAHAFAQAYTEKDPLLFDASNMVARAHTLLGETDISTRPNK